MAKLYEILLRQIGWGGEQTKATQEPTAEKEVYNPINAKIGSSINIDVLDFRDYRFFVREIRENVAKVGRMDNRFVDYVLQARPIDGDDFLCRLRLVPDQNPKTAMTHRAMVLSLYDDLAYNEGLHNVVRDNTKKFVIDDDKMTDSPEDDVHEEYWRVNDVGISYNADVKVLPGKVQESEIETDRVEFWDYSRMTDIEGVEIEEFIFVEMNRKSGWFQVWRGTEVNPERISVY